MRWPWRKRQAEPVHHCVAFRQISSGHWKCEDPFCLKTYMRTHTGMIRITTDPK